VCISASPSVADAILCVALLCACAKNAFTIQPWKG
jgi:hypothetical protein